MRKVLKLMKRTYRQVIRSIAFFPILISLLCIILAMVALTAENWEMVKSIKESVPHLFIQDYETTRSILSVFIGGIISLTVFSFSMVMVVLGQASSNFSPRLLPGLISSKKHQIILGTYVGTLLYCIIILTSLGALGTDANTIGLSTMLAAILSVVCIALFVYFIHTISGAIQIHNIINRINAECDAYARAKLEHSNTSKVALKIVDTSGWNVLPSITSGYFRGFDMELLKNTIEEKNVQLEIVPYKNEHIWEGAPLIRVKENLSEEELESLMFCIDISSDRHENDKGIGGLIKLMEIAVKAMSPGTNDPGTAIDVVAKLGGLLRKFLQFPKTTSQLANHSNYILIKNNVPADELMRIIIQPIRLYSHKDSTVLFELIGALHFVYQGPNISDKNRAIVLKELEAVRHDVEKHVVNQLDRKRLLGILEKPHYVMDTN